jgi:acetate CoA/acetoacetate CoA-transferase alpha subunit
MKAFITKKEVIDRMRDGMTVMVGGFLANGSPETLITAVLESGAKDLTVICNDGGFEDRGVGRLITAGRVKKLIASHIGTNPNVGKRMQDGTLIVELVPQGSLAEKIRAGGAGLGGILTPTGLNTVVQSGKKVINVQGVDYLLEEPLKGDLALMGGAIADEYGNLRYRGTMRNFNPLIAMACDIAIAEVSEVVKMLDPEMVITPHPLVDYILQGESI